MSDTSRDWLLDRISDGVLLLDPDWRATYINAPAEALLEVQRETVLGNEVTALPNTWKTASRQALSSGGQVTLPPAKRVHAGGNECVLEGEAHPAPGGGVGLVFRDGTDRRRAEEDLLLRNAELEAVKDHLQAKVSELAEATRARDRFLAVMSHEMRTPLNAILGYTELLDMGLGGDLSEVQQTHVDRIRVAGTHLLDLINDVLDLARADARKLGVDIRPVDAVAVVEEVVALLEAQAEAKGLRLRLETPAERLPQVRADLQRLRQILTNLLGNAIKFTERGSVVIRCEWAQGNMVHISIADTGIGIAEDTLPMIFSEFYQAEISSLTRARGGSGLGLAIAQRLARLMGGDVTAQSRLGEGSTFTLVLPAASTGEIVPSETLPPHRDPRLPNARDVSEPVWWWHSASGKRCSPNLAGRCTPQ